MSPAEECNNLLRAFPMGTLPVLKDNNNRSPSDGILRISNLGCVVLMESYVCSRKPCMWDAQEDHTDEYIRGHNQSVGPRVLLLLQMMSAKSPDMLLRGSLVSASEGEGGRRDLGLVGKSPSLLGRLWMERGKRAEPSHGLVELHTKDTLAQIHAITVVAAMFHRLDLKTYISICINAGCFSKSIIYDCQEK